MEIIRKVALLNAYKYGKTNAGKLIGKIIAEDSSLKGKIKEIMPEINKIVNEINSMPKDKIEEEIKSKYPELLEKKKEERDIFSSIKVDGEVITAFPPDPSKYPHIGHAKAAYINYLFAKKHKGRFYLRFEDTNPTLPKNEFYEQFINDLKWLGIEADEIFYASDFMEFFYEKARDLISNDYAYVCTCPPEKIKESREKGIACKCRHNGVKKNIILFDNMMIKDKNNEDYIEEGKAIVRLKIDLNHKNTTMRDPTIMRIIEHPHPRVGDKYRLWPNYDFENAILDGHTKVTHRFRTKEFELRKELQIWIQEKCQLPVTETFEFGRFKLKDIPTSGRIIREMIENGKLIGWDDPQLATLVALRRRGFTPEGIKEFLLATGITKNEATLTWDDLIAKNKRIVDKSCNRYFFIDNPVIIHIENAPDKEVKLKIHPEKDERTRHFETFNEFLITKRDEARINNMKDNSMIRLMDLMNFLKKGDKFIYHSDDVENYKTYNGEKAIVHWLPNDPEQLIETIVFMPDHEKIIGYSEKSIENLNPDELVQFERFGFCRLDAIDEEGIYSFWFTHA